MTPSRLLLSRLLMAAALAARTTGTGLAAGGEEGFDMLRVNVSAASAGAGDTGVALPDGLDAALRNPAVLGDLRRSELHLAGMRLLDDTSYTGVSAAFLGDRGSFALHGATFDHGHIPGYDLGGAPAPDVKASDTLLAAGYGRALGPRLWAGAFVKQVEESLGGSKARSLAGDAGVLWRPFEEGVRAGFRLGAAGRNVGSGGSFGREKVDLPTLWTLGASWRSFSEAWTTTLETERSAGGNGVIRAGQEVWLGGPLALRAGYRGSRDLAGGMTFGAGFRFQDLQVDYAFAAGEAGFDDVHRVSLTFRWGGRAEKIYQEGLDLLRRGRYGEAILKFNQVLDARPGHRRALERIREAATLLRKDRGE